MPSNSTLRASDAERERTASLLGEHLAAGRLALPEFEERLTNAYDARTRGELDGLLADLPDPAAARRSPVSSRKPVAGPARSAFAYDQLRPYASWLVTGVICLVIWAATSLAAGRPLSFWPGWVIGPWGAVLLTRAAARSRGAAWGGCGRVVRSRPHDG